MKSVSSMVFFKLFTKTTCENRLYYAEFGSSRLQKRLKYGGNVKINLYLVIFKSEKIKDFVLAIDKAFTNLLTTPYGEKLPTMRTFRVRHRGVNGRWK